MSGPTVATHRPSALKQQNKKHNKLGHKTKGQIRSLSEGRISLKLLTKKAKHELNRQERRNQLESIRTNKRQQTLLQKRSIGTAKKPPQLVCVIVFSNDVCRRTLLESLQSADSESVNYKCNTEANPSNQGNVHLNSPRFKQRFEFMLPGDDNLFAILDAVKVSNTVMIVWPIADRYEDLLTEKQKQTVSAIKAQGLPTTVHVTYGYHDLSSKRCADSVRMLLTDVEKLFPSKDRPKVFQLDKPGEALLCLRQIATQKQRSIFWRDRRPHLLAEKITRDEVEEGCELTRVHIRGYVRGAALSANSLVHIPGWPGDFQVEKVLVQGIDPYPLRAKGKANQTDTDRDGEIRPNELKQMALPGEGDYSANIDEEEFSGEESDGDYSDESDEFDADEPDDEEDEKSGDDEDDRMSVVSTSTAGEDYDGKMDYDHEETELQRIKDARTHQDFPDEIDTPRDEQARLRFRKYQGLESFKKSPWDLKANLPRDYGEICQIESFNKFRKRIMAMDPYKDEFKAEQGSYVTITLKNVPTNICSEYKVESQEEESIADKSTRNLSKVGTEKPIVLFALLPFEQEMSVLNVCLKSQPDGHRLPLKSKSEFIFNVGYRRFYNQPIFSEHSAGNKHKMLRYFNQGDTVIGSMYAPIMFPPSSVLMFQATHPLVPVLVATGSVYNVDPARCVLKRVVLSGFPFKINQRTVTVRYMFYDCDDINYFKSIKLATKYGRRGIIKDSLGTHGHMKCQFDAGLKSQDTILMHLYKRVFPKWRYRPYGARPAIQAKRECGEPESDDEGLSSGDEGLSSGDEMPPPAAKKVRFTK